MKSLLLYIFVGLSLASGYAVPVAGGEISGSVQKIVRHIQTVEGVVTHWNTEGGSPKEEENFKRLRKKATTADFLTLAQHSDVRVRCYAYWALACDSSVDLYQTILSHLSDTQTVLIMTGDCGLWKMAADFFIDVATTEWVDSRKLSGEQIARLDSFLICTDNSLYSTSTALERVGPIAWAYPRIRELAIENENRSALIALAKYRKEQDVELIRVRLNQFPPGRCPLETYEAAGYFPDPSLWTFVKMHFVTAIDSSITSFEMRGLYRAVASYQSGEAAALLSLSLEEIREHFDRERCVGYLFDALKEFRAPIYDQLILRLWSEDHKISSGILKYISERYPDSALRLAKASLAYLDELNYLDMDDEPDQPHVFGHTAGEIFNFVLVRDRGAAIQALVDGIERADVNTMIILEDWICRSRDTAVVSPVLKRVQSDDRTGIGGCLAVALWYLNDPLICQRITDQLAAKKELRKSKGGKKLIGWIRKQGHSISH